MNTPVVGLHPGTFDPVTNLALDVVARACRLAASAVLGVVLSAGRGELFDSGESRERVPETMASIAEWIATHAEPSP